MSIKTTIKSDIQSAIREFETNAELELKEIELGYKRAVLDLIDTIIDATPVDTGNLRGNWGLTLGTVSSALYGTKLSPRNPMAAYSAAALELGKFKLKNKMPIHIFNNTEYGEPIEFGSYSKKAPQGMMRISLANFGQALQREIGK